MVALKKPAIPPQIAPPTIAPRMHTSTWRPVGSPESMTPTCTATTVPTMYWPCPPMLNMPQRNANATASPVRTRIVNWISVCWRFPLAVHAAAVAVALEEQNEPSQFSPEPLKISR